MSDEMDEIWALYADDGAQSLDAMETALLALDGAGQGDPAGHVAALFRAVHTFKGNSRVLGLAVVESRAHLAEDLIGLVRDEGVPLDAEIVEILLLAADVLRSMLDETAQTRADVAAAGSQALMQRLEDKIARCKGAPLATKTEITAPPAMAPLPETPPPALPQAEPDRAPAAFVPDSFSELPDLPEDADFGLPPDPPPPPPEPAATAQPARLADDPAYRKIFLGMVEDTRDKLRSAMAGGDEAQKPMRRSVEGLAHAARQIGLPGWAAALDAFLAEPAPGPERIAALLLECDEREAQDFSVTQSQVNDTEGFLQQVRSALSDLAALGFDFSAEADHVARRQPVVARIVDPARQRGFVRVVEAAEALVSAPDRSRFREDELRLYEELAAVETALGSEISRDVSPKALLLNWCADHVFDTLAELSQLLERLRGGQAGDAVYNRFGQLMRRVHRACQHYHIDTAAQLSMSLLDLFARQHARGTPPDPILDHIAQGFISTIELVFDSLADGQEMPQGETLQKLFAEASSMAFVSEGVVTAGAIERKLGLPREFHRVLSPESVRAAAEALEQGLHFQIIRADINDDEAMAESFVLWLGRHGTRSITNVTVFRDADTLFDFLIATPLAELAVREALAQMDPSGQKIQLLHCLATETAPPPGETADGALEAAPAMPAPGISPQMLERIGEIATGQAMIHQMQQELAEDDLVEQIEDRLRAAGVAGELRADIRQRLAAQSDRQCDIAQLEAQLLAQMSLLQEETVALRSRPADILLQPVAALIRTLAHQAGRKVTVATLGGEHSLDVTVLDTLRGILRALAAQRVASAAEATSFRLTFRRDDESVQAVIEDNHPVPLAEDQLAPVLEMVAQAKGRLRQVAVPGGGTRLHLALPLSMVVIDGMVVGVGGVRYVLPVETISTILQVEQGAAFDIHAEPGRRMLRLPSQDVIPVRRMGAPRQEEKVYVILSIAGQRLALPVDEVIGQQLVLLRPLRGVLSRLQHLTGIALLAGGEVGMVLSGAALGGIEAA